MTLLLAALPTFAEVEKQTCDKMILVIGSGWEKQSEACRRAFEKAAEECADRALRWCVHDRPVGLGGEDATPIGRLPMQIYAYPAWIFADGENRPLRHREGVGVDEIARLPKAASRLAELRRARDAALKTAETLSGVQRAEAIGRALAPLLDPIISHYSEGAVSRYGRANECFFKLIRAADPEDTTGWYAKYAFRYSSFAGRELNANWNKRTPKNNEPILARALVNPHLLPIQRQYLKMLTARNLIEEDRMPEALAEFDAVAALAPETTVASAARNAKRYYTEPIALADGRWHKNANRPYWATAEMDVSATAGAAGTYDVVFNATQGRTLFRNARLVSQGKILAEDLHEGTSFELTIDVPAKDVRLRVEMKGTGWFGSYGNIEIKRR